MTQQTGTYYPPGVIELAKSQLKGLEALSKAEGYPSFAQAFQVLCDVLDIGQPIAEVVK